MIRFLSCVIPYTFTHWDGIEVTYIESDMITTSVELKKKHQKKLAHSLTNGVIYYVTYCIIYQENG